MSEGSAEGRPGRCELCRFWNSEADDAGFCQRYPPTVLHNSTARTVATEWPVTAADDWCGEFRPRDTAVVTVRPGRGRGQRG